uniref:Retrotransposon protein, putative, Ty1-copia subclass n=1 Tax=Oryza sativa subsp. japonica TaxID=39947 RepID=Q2QYG3_ORYSJ|nr:retrotransposon protein, putative, Ty1-copia subclass [Oryza sativa Japonica Group]
MVTRSKTSSLKPVDRVVLSAISPLPANYRSTLANPNWRAAMAKEFKALINNGTWRLVPRPPGANVITGKWIFKHKFHSDGSLARHKARWVVRGYSQQHGIDYDETFSPIVKPSTIRVVLSIATSRSWPIHQLDVKNAFLHGTLDETLGFTPSASDTSLFILRDGDRLAYLLLYVDDIILTASSAELLRHITARLHTEFAMTDLGDLHFFLGISVCRTPDGLFLSQLQYAVDLLQRAGMSECHPTATPVDTRAKLSASEGAPVADPTEYKSLAGALQYLTLTRPKIAYAVQQLIQELHAPISTTTIVFCNNVSAIYMTANPVRHRRTKHIEIDIHFVREKVALGQVRVLHVPSTHQFADIMTKGLPVQLFTDFRSSLCIRDPPAVTAGGY